MENFTIFRLGYKNQSVNFLRGKKFTVCCVIHTKRESTLCGQNVEF